MHNNIRLKGQRFELSLGSKQVVALLVAVLVVLGSAFALGLGVGRRTGASAAQPPTAPSDALAALDEARAARVEPPPESKAQQAPSDSRSNDETDKTMPLPTVKSVNAPGAPTPHADGKTSPEPEMAAPPAIATSPAPEVPASPTITITPPPTIGDLHSPSAPRGGEAKPSPASQQSSSKGTYTVQVASASNRAGAERLAKQLAARKPRIVAADVPGMGRRYRVQIGAFDTREAAKEQAVSLSQVGVHGVVTPR
jgi:hypothetical protein